MPGPMNQHLFGTRKGPTEHQALQASLYHVASGHGRPEGQKTWAKYKIGLSAFLMGLPHGSGREDERGRSEHTGKEEFLSVVSPL